MNTKLFEDIKHPELKGGLITTADMMSTEGAFVELIEAKGEHDDIVKLVSSTEDMISVVTTQVEVESSLLSNEALSMDAVKVSIASTKAIESILGLETALSVSNEDMELAPLSAMELSVEAKVNYIEKMVKALIALFKKAAAQAKKLAAKAMATFGGYDKMLDSLMKKYNDLGTATMPAKLDDSVVKDIKSKYPLLMLHGLGFTTDTTMMNVMTIGTDDYYKYVNDLIINSIVMVKAAKDSVDSEDEILLKLTSGIETNAILARAAIKLPKLTNDEVYDIVSKKTPSTHTATVLAYGANNKGVNYISIEVPTMKDYDKPYVDPSKSGAKDFNTMHDKVSGKTDFKRDLLKGIKVKSGRVLYKDLTSKDMVNPMAKQVIYDTLVFLKDYTGGIKDVLDRIKEELTANENTLKKINGINEDLRLPVGNLLSATTLTMYPNNMIDIVMNLRLVLSYINLSLNQYKK